MPTACEKVLYTPELFEEILFQLFEIASVDVCRPAGDVIDWPDTFFKIHECGSEDCKGLPHQEYSESIAQAELMRVRRVSRLWDQVIMQSPRIQRQTCRGITPKPAIWRTGLADSIKIHPVSAGVIPDNYDEFDQSLFMTEEGGVQLCFEICLEQIEIFTTAAKGKRSSLHSILITNPPITALDMYIDFQHDYDTCFQTRPSRPKYDADGCKLRCGSRLCTVVRKSGLTIGDLLEAAEKQLECINGTGKLQVVSMDHLKEKRIVPNTIDMNKMPQVKSMKACEQVFRTPELFENIFCWLFRISYKPSRDEDGYGIVRNGWFGFCENTDCNNESSKNPHHRQWSESIAQAEIMRARRVCRYWNMAIMQSPRLLRQASRKLKVEPEVWRGHTGCVEMHSVSEGVFNDWQDFGLYMATTASGGTQIQLEVDNEDIEAFNRVAKGNRTSMHTILFSRPPPTTFDVIIATANPNFFWDDISAFDADGCRPQLGSRLCTYVKSTGFTIGDVLKVAEKQMARYRIIKSILLKSQDHLEKPRNLPGTIVLG